MLSRFSRVWLFATLWTVAHHSPLSMEFSRQEYWSGSPSPSPGDLPDSEIKAAPVESPALAGGFFTTEPPGRPSEQICLSPFMLALHSVRAWMAGFVLHSNIENNQGVCFYLLPGPSSLSSFSPCRWCPCFGKGPGPFLPSHLPCFQGKSPSQLV